MRVSPPPPNPCRSTASSCARAPPACTTPRSRTRSRCDACRMPTCPLSAASCPTPLACQVRRAARLPAWAARPSQQQNPPGAGADNLTCIRQRQQQLGGVGVAWGVAWGQRFPRRQAPVHGVQRKPARDRQARVVCGVAAGVESFQDTNKVLAISRVMVAWLPVGMAAGERGAAGGNLQGRRGHERGEACWDPPRLHKQQGGIRAIACRPVHASASCELELLLAPQAPWT